MASNTKRNVSLRFWQKRVDPAECVRIIYTGSARIDQNGDTQWATPSTWFHIDRVAGGDRNHRHSGGAADARPGEGEGESAPDIVPQQSKADWARMLSLL